MPRFLVTITLLLLNSLAGADIRIETLASGLDHPWSLAFLPDGTVLVTERAGRLRVMRDGKLLDQPVANVPDAYVAGQGGLFDVVPDPDFSRNRRIYISYAHGDKRANATRVLRAVFDGAALHDLQVIFTASPMKATPHHFGGRMAFLQDGTLLLTTGDGFNYREAAQRLGNHLGKVIRITTDGEAPGDNPFIGTVDAKAEIWSYGHRNPQAIVVMPESGEVLLHEHGPRGGDELNRILPGRNYGWPVATYGIDYPGSRISPYTEYPGMEQPLVHWTPSIAPAGMTYYDGALFPEWRGDLFVAALAEKSLRRLDLENGVVVAQQILLADAGMRIRDVRTGLHGALYLLTDDEDGKVLRITPD